MFVFLCLGSFCFADEQIKNIPAIYVSPELTGLVAEYPAAVINGYIFIDNINQAERFFRPIPPDINLQKENVIIFAWNGSSVDKIDHEKDENNMHHFVLKRGKANDLYEHVKIYAINKEEEFLFHRVLE